MSGQSYSPEILLSHKVRDEESMILFENMLAEKGFTVRKVQTMDALGERGLPDAIMYHIRK